jgi:ABC-type uncharacterized transport system ATPase subunit
VLHDPRLVILDEPFSGLDVSASRVLKAFVRALAGDGNMVVFSSHVLEVVEQVCSRVLILKDGRVVEHDSVVRCGSTSSGRREMSGRTPWTSSGTINESHRASRSTLR